MKKIFLLLILALTFNVGKAQLKGNWKAMHMPEEGYVYCIASMGSNILQGTSRGLYSTPIEGSIFTEKKLGPKDIKVFSFVKRGTTLFAGTNKGLFSSTDFGESWTAAINKDFPPSLKGLSLAILDSNIFALIDNELYLSVDYGNSWTSRKNKGFSKGKVIKSFTISDSKLFALSDSNVYLSLDYGDSWNSISNDSILKKGVKTFKISGKNIFLLTKRGVFLSTNLGNNWIPINKGLPTVTVNGLEIFGSNIILGFSNYSNYYYLSTNNGESWTEVISDLYPLFQYYDINDTNLVGYWSSYYDGDQILISRNNGISWKGVKNGLKAFLTGYDLNSLAISGTNIFAGDYGAGVFLSANNRDTLVPVHNGLTNLNVNTLANIDTNIFAGTDGGGVFLSSNNGSNWKEVNSGLTNLRVNTLCINGSDIFAGTADGVFLSTNNGAIWKKLSNSSDISNVLSLAISGSKIFVGTEGSGVFLSENYGVNWSQLKNTWLFGKIESLAIKTNIYAGTESGKLYFSGKLYPTVYIENYDDWSSFNFGHELGIRSLLVTDTNIFAGTAYGTYFSANNSFSWVKIILNNWRPNSNALAKNETTFFAASGSTVLIHPLAGIIAANIESDINKRCLRIYPNPSGGKFMISDNTNINSVIVQNMLGEIIYSNTNFKQQLSKEIDLSDFKKGIYFVTIYEGDKSHNEKILIE